MLLLVQVASEGNQQESKWIQPQAHGVSVARRQRIRTRPGPRSENFTIPLRLKAIQYLDTTRSAVTPKGRFDPWRSLMGVSIRHVAVASGVYCEESCLVVSVHRKRLGPRSLSASLPYAPRRFR